MSKIKEMLKKKPDETEEIIRNHIKRIDDNLQNAISARDRYIGKVKTLQKERADLLEMSVEDYKEKFIKDTPTDKATIPPAK